MLLRVSLLAVVFIYCMMSYRIGYMISFLFIVQNRFTLCGKCSVCFFMCRENGEKVEKRNIISISIKQILIITIADCIFYRIENH